MSDHPDVSNPYEDQDGAPEDQAQPYETMEGGYNDNYNSGENQYETAGYDQYATDGGMTQVGDAVEDGYGQETYGQPDYLQNEEYAQQGFNEQDASGQEAYSQYADLSQQGFDEQDASGQETYSQYADFSQQEFSERDPSGQEAYSQYVDLSQQGYTEQGLGGESNLGDETYETGEYPQYPQQEFAPQNPVGEYLGYQGGPEQTTPSQGAQPRAGLLPDNQGKQLSAGHPGASVHQRGASVLATKAQPGHHNVQTSPVHAQQAPSPAHPAQLGPTQPPRASPQQQRQAQQPGRLPPQQQRPAQQRPAQQQAIPRPGAPQANAPPHSQALPNTQHRPNQPTPQPPKGSSNAPPRSQASPNTQPRPNQQPSTPQPPKGPPNPHTQPLATNGQAVHGQAPRPQIQQNAPRPLAGRPNSPPSTQHSAVPPRNLAVGSPKPAPGPLTNVGRPGPPPSAQHSVPQATLPGAPHAPPHHGNSLPPRRPAVGPNAPPHASPPLAPHPPAQVAVTTPAVVHKVPPPGYTPNLQPQGPKREELGVVTHQHELKITHEHVAPMLTNHQQPSAIPGMVIDSKGGNRNIRNLAVIEGQGRAWSSGLCSFTDKCDTFCYGCWCPCIVYGQNKARLDYLTSHGITHPENGGSCCSNDCCLHGSISLCGVGLVLQTLARNKTRSRYNIRGSGFEDCCTTLCCGPCALTQESKEMRLEEISLMARKR